MMFCPTVTNLDFNRIWTLSQVGYSTVAFLKLNIFGVQIVIVLFRSPVVIIAWCTNVLINHFYTQWFSLYFTEAWFIKYWSLYWLYLNILHIIIFIQSTSCGTLRVPHNFLTLCFCFLSSQEKYELKVTIKILLPYTDFSNFLNNIC